MTPRIRAVIFDMDGVLTDSEPLINAAAIAMFGEKGLIVQPEDFLPFVGAGEDRYIGGVAEKYHFPLDLPEAKQRTYEIYLSLVPSRLEAFPGVHPLLLACRQAGLRVAVASSADRIKVVANLQKIKLPAESWDAVVTAEHVEHKKPIAGHISFCRANPWSGPSSVRSHRGRGQWYSGCQSSGDALHRRRTDFSS